MEVGSPRAPKPRVDVAAGGHREEEVLKDNGSGKRTSTNLWGEWMGVMHGDEIEYVFGHPLNQSLQYNKKERDLSIRMMQAYSRFALLGKPMAEGVEWPTYSRDQPQYFIFDAEESGLGKGPRATACAFWNEFLPRLKGVPDPPEVCDGAVASIVSAGSKRIYDLRFLIIIFFLITTTTTTTPALI